MSLKRNRVTCGDDLSRLDWRQFEALLADHYRGAGYDVEHCGTGGTGSHYDGGIDLVLRRDGETTLVQCKHWNAAQVPHNVVHEMLGMLVTRHAQHAILVTSGEFTLAARDWAARSPRITLVDGASLRDMIDPARIPAPASTLSPHDDPARRGSARRPSLIDEMKGLAVRVLIAGSLLLLGVALLRIWWLPSLAMPVHAAPSPHGGQERLRGITVQGTMVSGGKHLVVVDLAGLEVGEAQDLICRDAERWFRQSLSGVDVYVQRDRGREPAVDAGVIVC